MESMHRHHHNLEVEEKLPNQSFNIIIDPCVDVMLLSVGEYQRPRNYSRCCCCCCFSCWIFHLIYAISTPTTVLPPFFKFINFIISFYWFIFIIYLLFVKCLAVAVLVGFFVWSMPYQLPPPCYPQFICCFIFIISIYLFFINVYLPTYVYQAVSTYLCLPTYLFEPT